MVGWLLWSQFRSCLQGGHHVGWGRAGRAEGQGPLYSIFPMSKGYPGGGLPPPLLLCWAGARFLTWTVPLPRSEEVIKIEWDWACPAQDHPVWGGRTGQWAISAPGPGPRGLGRPVLIHPAGGVLPARARWLPPCSESLRVPWQQIPQAQPLALAMALVGGGGSALHCLPAGDLVIPFAKEHHSWGLGRAGPHL